MYVVISCRDLVHRQTACAAIKHMALGVSGFGCEDALTHLINYVWPNIFETSPHVINAVMESIEGMRVALGPSRVLHYCLQVSYWRLSPSGFSRLTANLSIQFNTNCLYWIQCFFFFFFTILGNVSPGAKSSRCLLEDLQQLIHWISGKTPKEFKQCSQILWFYFVN